MNENDEEDIEPLRYQPGTYEYGERNQATRKTM